MVSSRTVVVWCGVRMALSWAVIRAMPAASPWPTLAAGVEVVEVARQQFEAGQVVAHRL